MTAARPLLLLGCEDCRDHAPGDGHPEDQGRIAAVVERLHAGPLAPGLVEEPPRAASWEAVLAAHDGDYLLRLEEAALAGRPWIDHRDNRIAEGSWRAALLAAGAGPAAIDRIEGGGPGHAFCAVRPPGHHAERGRALGFCLLNNAVIAVRHWQRAHGRRRVLVLDFDAHHGNGVQRAFETDPDVVYVSLHEHPTFSFPGTGFAEETGSGAGEGATLNIPLLPGSGDGEALAAVAELVEPLVAGVRPEAIVVAAGFDGHLLDDMSGLGYSTDLFGRLGRRVAAWARDHCSGRSLTLLEGGYHHAALAEGAERYLLGLLEMEVTPPCASPRA